MTWLFLLLEITFKYLHTSTDMNFKNHKPLRDLENCSNMYFHKVTKLDIFIRILIFSPLSIFTHALFSLLVNFFLGFLCFKWHEGRTDLIRSNIIYEFLIYCTHVTIKNKLLTYYLLISYCTSIKV